MKIHANNMHSIYLVFFAAAFLLSLLASFAVARLATQKGIVDVPDEGRHLHKKSTPMLGGLAVYFGFFIATLTIGFFGGHLLNGNIPLPLLLGVWGGGAILMVGGYLDDKFHLSAKYSIISPVLACLLIVAVGVKAVSVHSPLSGNVIILDDIQIYGLKFLSGLVVFLWTMTLTYTTKLLDGMDGLVAGICAIAAMVLFGLSLSPEVMQPQTAMLAAALAGSLLGFLVLNFHPAKIFLGESGSTFAGFLLAVLAIISGGKIATTLLVMGIPFLDMLWVIFRRLRAGRSMFSGDREHLHFRLKEIGLSEPQTVLLLYFLTAMFGLAGLFLQSRGKLVAFVILIVVMLAIVASLVRRFRHPPAGGGEKNE